MTKRRLLSQRLTRQLTQYAGLTRPKRSVSLSATLAIWTASFLTFAPGAFSQPFTLDQILDMATGKNPTVDTIQEQYKVGEATIATGRAGTMPKVDLTSRATWFSGDKNFFPRNAKGGTEDNVYSLSLSLVQPLITFGRIGAVWEIADLTEKTNSLQRKTALDSFQLGVLAKYGQVWVSERRKAAQKTSMDLLGSLYKFTKVEFEGGGRSRVDLLRSQSAFEAAKASYSLADIESDAELSKLKIMLGIPPADAFEISTDQDMNAKFLDLSGKEKAISDQLELQKLNKEIASERRQFERSAYYPSISLFGNAGIENKPDADELTKTDKIVYSYGLVLNWNLFDGLGTSANVDMAKANSAIANLQYDTALKEYEVERSLAKKRIDVVRQVYKASESSHKATKLAFRQADSDYRAGVVPLTQLLDLESELLNASQRQAKAYVDLLLAVGNYKLLTGQKIH